MAHGIQGHAAVILSRVVPQLVSDEGVGALVNGQNGDHHKSGGQQRQNDLCHVAALQEVKQHKHHSRCKDRKIETFFDETQ